VSRRRRLLLIALVLGATAAYALWRAPDWGARLVEHALAGYFHRPVRVAAVTLRPRTLEVEVHDLRVAGLSPGAPPFLEVASARVRPSFAPVRGSRIVLSRVRVEGLSLRINAFPSPPLGPGGDDIPKMGGGRGGGVQVSIQRLVIVGGEFVLNHQRVPLDLDLPDFHGRLVGRPEGGLAGHISFAPGRLQMGRAPELPFGTEIDVIVHRGVVDIQGARAVAEKTNLAYRGRIRLSGRPQGQLSLAGPVDLAVLERHVFRTTLGLAGDAQWNGLLSIDGSRLRIEGRIEGTAGAFMGVAVPRFAGWLSYDGTSGLVMRDLDLGALGGSARLAIDVPPTATRRPVHIRGPVRAVDGEGILRMLFGWGEMRLGTAATGDVDVSWPKGKNRLLSGTIGVDLAVRADGRTPLAGRFDWRAEDGRQTYEHVVLRGPGMSGTVTGDVDAEERARLEIQGQTDDLAAAETLLTRIRRALGNAEAQPAGFRGSGSFRGLWRGTVDWPVFDGRFDGKDVTYAGVNWGRAQWTGTFDTAAESVQSRPLVLRKGAGEIVWNGLTQVGWFGTEDAIDGRGRATAWPVEDIVKFMEWDVVATGLLSGEASVRGRRSAPEGEAKGTARAGRYYAIPYDEARIESRWKGHVAEVTRGEVRLGGGTLAFRGSVTDDGVYDGTGEMEGVDLGALAPAPVPGAPLGGRLSGRLALQGTLVRPRLRATLSSPRLFLGDEGIGALDARLVGTGDGRVAVDGTCRSARVDVALAGAVGASPPYAADLTLSARSTSLDPFLRAVQPTLPAALAVVASGEVRVRGPLESPSGIRAEATVPDLQLLLPEFAVRSRAPVRLTFAGGRLEVADLQLAGEGTDLAVTGGLDVLGDGPLAVAVRGQADLSALSLVTRRLRGAGAARLAVDISGTRAAPRVLGTLDFDGAGLRARGFPHGVEGLYGRVRFTESSAELEGVSGTVAGGQLTVEGQAAYSGGRLTSYDVRPVARGLALRYPEGLRSLVDADLRLFGDASKQWITGTVDLRQALYTKRYDVASEILSARRALPAPEASSLDEGAQLDLHVRAPGTVRIDNNLATLAASADLQVQGTTRAPIVTGRAEIERGRLYFQGRTYVIQKGTLDFVNPRRLDPLFDIEAVTRIRAYQVTLRVSGTLERVTPTLTSDPPLSSLQILALLAGQDETQVANLTQTQARQSQAQLAAAGAAQLAAGRLSESVGLEREAERLFGLNRFSIDPSLLRGASSTPTARVTVGKRILTPDLNVLYSQDLRGTEERILAIEYLLTDRFSLLLTRTDPGTAKTGVERGWSFDVRIRQSH
jgi:autotransporter translocation and assembly factor TamB